LSDTATLTERAKKGTMTILNSCCIDETPKIDLATLVALITALTALLTGIYSIIHSRRTTYINAVTTARLKYIENLRNYVSEFCGLVLANINSIELNEKIDRLRFTIKLHLNRKNDFDIKVLEQLDKIPNFTSQDKKDELHSNLTQLTNLMQDIFALEWEGIRLEATSGKPSEKEKEIFTNKHKQNYGKNI